MPSATPVADVPGSVPARPLRRGLAAWLMLLLLVPAGVSRAQSLAAPDAPLPDLVTLAREVRARLEPDAALLRQYTYRERRRDVKVSKLGKVRLGPWREFEVYPSTVRGETYKRLVAVGGKPLPAEELDRRDAAHRAHVLDRHAQLEVETPADREKRLARTAKERREDKETVDDAFRVLEPTGLRRVQLDGRPTLVVELTPRPGVQPRTDAGKYMSRMRGTLWINEADRQVVRVEMEVIRDITFGLGILARLHTGSEMTFRRSLVNGEIWLPAEATFKAAGRAVLFRTFDVETTTRYSDYRKFDVTTTEDVVDAGSPNDSGR